MVMEWGEQAVELPWLTPCASSLVALASCESAKSVWPQIRTDPGCVLLLARHTTADVSTTGQDAFPANTDHLAALKTALKCISQFNLLPTANWNARELHSIYQCSLTYARTAQTIALHSEKCDPEIAWVCGLLAPLGWHLLATLSPETIQKCLEECRIAEKTVPIQRDYFGLDYAAVARRVNHRWHLPSWLAAVTGHLALPPEIACLIGANESVFQITQLAVSSVEHRRLGMKLACGSSPTKLCERMQLNDGEVQSWFEELPANQSEALKTDWQNPQSLELLPELLRVSIEKQQMSIEPDVDRLQGIIDVLQSAVTGATKIENQDLHTQKMTAMAEFSAGAAHEINNPLAVISGHAQYLMSKEADSERKRILEKIVGQTKRVRRILTDLLLFARPKNPKKQIVDAGALVRQVVNSLQSFADDREVCLKSTEPALHLTVFADIEQVTEALSCLLQNAIESAAEDGWAGIRVVNADSDKVHFVVEDNGQGPNALQRDLLFDPFFSGRDAGRGKGLGLPIAWRLARLNDGDVFLNDKSASPTQFVLSLPKSGLPANRSNGHRNGLAHVESMGE